jgi:hypothetical protein
MHRIRNVLTKMVLKNSLGDQGTWLPLFPRSPKGHLSRSPFITLRASLLLTICALVALRQASSHLAQRDSFGLQLPSTLVILLHHPGSISRIIE